MANKNIVSKLNQIKSLVDSCLADLIDDKSEFQDQVTTKSSVDNYNPEDLITPIVNKIKNCPEFEKIESQILSKKAISARVLLPYYICHKYFPEWGLTTGDIEKVTSELNVKVKTPNISKCITNLLWKYLDGNSSRVQGKPVTYKLNSKGVVYFDSLLNNNGKN